MFISSSLMKSIPISALSSHLNFARLMTLFVAAALCNSVLAAGFARLEVPAADGESALHAMVWSPCATQPTSVEIGPYVVQGVPNCNVAGEKRALVVISHGKGASLLSHHDTATALANAGFIVAALNHPGDSFGDDAARQQLTIFESRPRDISRLISFMTQHWTYRQQLDANAIGVFGFSRGGYTALALAGAVPNASASAERLCAHWLSSVNSLCRQLKANETQFSPKADPRIRAAVVVDPLNLFDTHGLQAVRIPVQLWASEQGGDGVTLAHVEAIRAALPQVPDYHVAQGAGHFAYLAPCSQTLEKAAPSICNDPKDFDRIEWHMKMNSAVVSFFKQKLP